MKINKRNIFLFIAFLLVAVGIALTCPGKAQSAKKKNEGMPDNLVETAIETDLVLDAFVSPHLIDLEVKGGIVTITGFVDNILAKERTVRIAESVKGVKGVIDKVRVSPVFRKDTDIRKDAMKALRNDPSTDHFDIKVLVDEGAITLKGKVDSWAEKTLAERVVQGTRGVREVVNKIEVRETTARSDAEIKAEIEKMLDYDIYLSGSDIKVNVSNSKVTLRGVVGSARLSSLAEKKSRVEGVSSVKNDLSVQAWSGDITKRDEYIENLIKDDGKLRSALQTVWRHDPRLKTFRLSADIKNGVATLEGEVNNLRAKIAAQDDALNTVGIWRIKNNIKVRPVIKTTDAKIARETMKALSMEPLINPYRINAVVLNKKLYLYGRVHNPYEKLYVERVASAVPGIVEIENNIALAYKWEWKSDKAIEDDIKDQIFWSFLVDSDDIGVNVKEGIVTLKGKVGGRLEHRAVIRNAFEGGAKKVRDRLKVEHDDNYPSGNFFDSYPPGLYFNMPKI